MTGPDKEREGKAERRQAGRRGRIALALGAFALGAAGFGLGWALRPAPHISAVVYGNERLFAINAHLADAPPGYVFLAGDSYMELYSPEPLPCGREIVNGGVGGAKAGDYLRFLDSIRFRSPPSAVLLSVGLNNLLKKSNPGGPASLAAFRASAEALIRRLGETGARVVVVAVPPVPLQTAKYFDVDSIETYTQVLRDICAAQGCTVKDVFAEARDGALWQAKAGLSADGLHLSNLRRYYRGAYEELCR